MSEFEQQESRSSVEITTTAKGEALVKIKIYSGSDDAAEVDNVRTVAVNTYLATREALAGKVALA